jgi:rSAM/selenodomain-associated transferase 1
MKPATAANAIMIFAKSPIPGRVKTRLCPPLRPEEAVELYKSFVKDTIHTAQAVKNSVTTILYDPSTQFPGIDWLGPGFPESFISQKGRDLGDKLSTAFLEAFARGAERVLAIGSDLPHLERDIIESAFSMLDKKDVVLGPAEDGGYYLIGLKRCWNDLFSGIAWSTSRVFKQTVQRTQNAGLSMGILPRLYDVDTASELNALEALLQKNTEGMDYTRKTLIGLRRRGAMLGSLRRRP